MKLERSLCRPDQSAVIQQLPSGTNSHTAQTQITAHSMTQAAPTFGLQQVVELYRNTLKLASENKITKDNTWALGLIDHMSDLVKPSDEERGQTNFQRASCTLDAGVKIYSYRVDSVHNSIYKTLGGLSRTAGPSQQDDAGNACRLNMVHDSRDLDSCMLVSSSWSCILYVMLCCCTNCLPACFAPAGSHCNDRQ